jgi:hypothetical protein
MLSGLLYIPVASYLECKPVTSEPPNPIDGQQPETHASPESTKQESSPEQQIPPTPAKAQANKPPHCCEVTCKTRRDWIDWATIVLEAFGLTVLIVYTIYTARMYCANRDAADAAKSAADTASRTMKIAYQPRVIIASLGPNVTTKPGNKPGVNFLEDGRIRMISNISNIGPFTAKNVHYFTFWEIIGKRENAQRLSYSEAKEPFGYPKVILPKSTGYDSSSAFFTDRLTPKQIKTIGSPEVWTEFSVLITYDDDFGDTHGTEYCDMFIIGGPQDICPWDIRND